MDRNPNQLHTSKAYAMGYVYYKDVGFVLYKMNGNSIELGHVSEEAANRKVPGECTVECRKLYVHM